ncbi:M6PR (predicted) [Pycnogonum litorale]
MLNFEIIFFLIAICVSNFVYGDGCRVNFANSSKDSDNILKRLNPLRGERFVVWKIANSQRISYKFDIGICTSASHINDSTFDVGALQTVDKPHEESVELGKFTNTSLSCGTNWIMIKYLEGDKYQNVCNSVKRSVTIMITCNQYILKGRMHLLEAYMPNVSDSCYYMFQFESKVACDGYEEHRSISSGSIFCILFFSGIGIYLLFGFLYQRCIVGAKGYEQCPNFSFWQEFGELQADGCDFICRWGNRNSHCEYKGIDNDLRHNTSLIDDDDSSDQDESLLPV